MILTCNQEHSRLIKRLFWTTMSSANELPIIHNFIMQLEEYINRNGLCSRAEYPFNIIGETSLNLSPLGITENQLIAFCQKIRANQGNLDATFSNYLKALNNSSLLKIINDTATTNAFFVMVMYMHNPLHMEIVTIKDPEELLYDLQTPDEVKELITDQDGIYYNLLNLDSDKDESDSYSSEEDYHYSDL